MPTMEVRRLVTRFESNRKVITPLQSKLDKLQRDYKNSWYKIRTECEKSGHDNVVGKQERVFFSSYHCPYCRKLLFPVRLDCDSWPPDSILDAEYCSYWLNIAESDWPEEKRQMLKKIKAFVKKYFEESGPVESSLKILRAEQASIIEKLQEIFELCDTVLEITSKHQTEMKEQERKYRRANRKMPPFNDPDAFLD